MNGGFGRFRIGRRVASLVGCCVNLKGAVFCLGFSGGW